MNKYGITAIRARDIVISQSIKPQDAWEEASVQVFGMNSSSKSKSCPKNAFLGLCESGCIKGIPSGSYTRSIKNKGYAIAALDLLRENSSDFEPSDLWSRVMKGEIKQHNSQMDVVLALWEQGSIE